RGTGGGPMKQLEGRVALITGASKGVGRVMSRMFAREGAAVICAARSRDLVEETTALVKADGGRAIAVVGDAAVEADVQRIVQAGLEAFGTLDTLVSNAGAGGTTRAVEEERRRFGERSRLKRMSTAEDIASLAVYLCSDAAKNLSGQCIAVTAGEPAG